ncbi:proteasome assembly chaperone family protein [Natronocalculus amylovorans]|uniref:PAC2 family protein n=1 Tax=Natronocalculus amylovorans TaxID=2917812 RepID=A0AAE3K7P3_9EURY|nr:PAC2 family protein [Natronocalculus amylovorans]MCL9816236.1 PAC2 family protein [Natronocalculus amylovorans]
MFGFQRRNGPTFSIEHRSKPSEILITGFSAHGLAGLTAANYLVDYLSLREEGYIRVEELPSITPFEQGQPRHPIRLYSKPNFDITILVSELFVPASFGGQLSSEILEWTEKNQVAEITIPAGVPIPHGPDGHQTYYIATEDYQQRRLTDMEVPPMGNGFLDGINAALIEQGMESSLGVGLLVTPVHAQTPDVEAAIRLVETISEIYELDIDASPLEAFAAEVSQYYNELAHRMEQPEVDLPEDRMYM